MVSIATSTHILQRISGTLEEVASGRKLNAVATRCWEALQRTPGLQGSTLQRAAAAAVQKMTLSRTGTPRKRSPGHPEYMSANAEESKDDPTESKSARARKEEDKQAKLAKSVNDCWGRFKAVLGTSQELEETMEEETESIVVRPTDCSHPRHRNARSSQPAGQPELLGTDAPSHVSPCACLVWLSLGLTANDQGNAR